MRKLLSRFVFLCLVQGVEQNVLASAGAAKEQTGFRRLMEDHQRGLAYFLPVPLIRQSRNFTCGAAAVQSIFHFWGDEFREGQLARLLSSNPDTGTSVSEILKLVRTLNRLKGKERKEIFLTPAHDETEGIAASTDIEFLNKHSKYKTRIFLGLKDRNEIKNVALFGRERDESISVAGMDFHALETELRKGLPVVVLLQAWPDKPPEDWSQVWDHGHYAVVIGYDRNNIYFMDPSTTGNYSYIPRDEFLLRWRDWSEEVFNGEKYRFHFHQFGMILEREKKAFDFDSVLLMR